MDKKWVDKLLLIVSILLFFVMSASFLIMPLDIYMERVSSSAVNIISGLCFWIPLVGGCIMQFFLAMRRKQWMRIHKKAMDSQKRVGVVSIFENKPAIVADLVMIISFVVCVAVFACTDGSGYFCYIIVALFVFSFCMHCILNGKNFRFTAGQTKMQREN
ncbi:MAG: hypothetical protein HFI75_05045 [Lachnospiraceae bacterium]|nr:hypothetical protein [Lachnospiraceae bacterium]